MSNILIKKLKKKSRHTLRDEQRDLQDRQKFLRKKRDTLWEQRDLLKDSLYKALKADDEDTEKLILKQIEDIKSEISEIDKEYQSNSTSLECYSKVTKNRDDTKNGFLGTLIAGLGTVATIELGKHMTNMAYDADTNGILTNKKVLDVLGRLNPFRLLGGGKK